MRAPYEQPAKCTGKGYRGEKESDAIIFTSLVPYAKIEHNSREEPTFCDAQERAGDGESGGILDEPRENTDDPPCEGESRKPESRRCELESDVTRDLEQDATNVVDGQRCEVFVSG